MKARICLLVLLSVCVITGCTSKRGIIILHTRPPEANIYVDDVKQGISPVEFEYDFSQPANLKIEKSGYYTETETLNKAWVVREIRKGNCMKGYYEIQGETIKAWKVTTQRLLQKK